MNGRIYNIPPAKSIQLTEQWRNDQEQDDIRRKQELPTDDEILDPSQEDEDNEPNSDGNDMMDIDD